MGCGEKLRAPLQASQGSWRSDRSLLPQATSTLTKSRQFGNCCSRLLFSRMYCGRRWDHWVTGTQNHRVMGAWGQGSCGEGKQELLPDFISHIPLPLPNLQSQNYSPEGYSFRGHWRPRARRRKQRETEGRHCIIIISPSPEGPCKYLSQITSFTCSEPSHSTI